MIFENISKKQSLIIAVIFLLIFSATTFFIFKWLNAKKIGEAEVINIVEPVIKIDKIQYNPLEVASINFSVDPKSLPMSLMIKEVGEGDIFFQKQLTENSGSVSVPLGGKIGRYEVYLEKNNEIISKKLYYDLDAEFYINTGDLDFDNFYPQVKQWMQKDILTCNVFSGYRSPDTDTIWLRDHTYQMAGFKYWEQDMKSLIDDFSKYQKTNGEIPDYICLKNKIQADRMGVEADVEYLYVLAAYQAWQATGDDEWIFSHLADMENALLYSMNSSHRWSSEYGLIKRPFTIDLWDFQWGDGAQEINQNTRFGILSSDNSGFYKAAKILSSFFGLKGNNEKKNYWDNIASQIKNNSNKYLWDDINGYYKGFFHIEAPNPAVDIDESKILSLSNVYNINRDDFSSQNQKRRVIEEYMRRADTSTWNGKKIFQEWFSIDPNYGNNKFGNTAKIGGEYANGGIMPFVGGELAKAALENGFEDYGIQNIKDYIELTKNAGNKTYLWYWPDGRPGITQNTLSTDGWGSSAFLSAFIEGLVGVKDLSKQFNDVYFSPKWAATTSKGVSALIKYSDKNGYLAYKYELDAIDNKLRIKVASHGSNINAHILLPGSIAKMVKIDDEEIKFENQKIKNSDYVDFIIKNNKLSEILIEY